MKFTIITPCRNSEAWIADTVTSIAQQTALTDGKASVEYILMDGASTDGTVRQAQKAWQPAGEGAQMRIISEGDSGMYDALAKGLRQATGDFVGYLNAGDYYSPHCLAVVTDVVASVGVEWLTGMRVTYSTSGALISAKVPWRYSSSMIRQGFYGLRGRGRFIQQESTFWSSRLNSSIDLTELSQFKLAGDAYLWQHFARSTELDVVSAYLGGFRFHGDHLSQAISEYRGEGRKGLDRASVLGYVRGPLHEALSWIPIPVRRKLPWHPPNIVWQRDRQEWSRI